MAVSRLLKIVFLVRSLDCGGAERQLVLLVSALHARGHDVSVTSFYPNGFYEKVLRERGVRVYSAGRRGRWDIAGSLMRILRHLKKERPEILHSYMNLANTAAGMFKWYLKPARVVWGVRSCSVDSRDYGWLTGIGATLERAVSRFADLIICNSEAAARSWQSIDRNGQVISIPNGFDPGEFFIDREARQRVRTEWGVKRDEILIGRVGRLDPVKDYPTFLKAAALMCPNDRLRFVCVGSGPQEYEKELKAMGNVAGLGSRLIWTGLATEMRGVYNALDLVVSSSKSTEGFPNVLLEAMACGTACVSTDVGDSRNMVQSSGRIVPPSNPEALAEACLEMIREKPLAENVRASVLTRYSVNVLVHRTEQAFANFLMPHASNQVTPLSRLNRAPEISG